MKRQRRKHAAEFKAKIAPEALKGMDTINEIAAKSEVHPAQVATWKKELLDRGPELFERKNAATDKMAELEIAHLQRKVEQFSMEVNFLDKKSIQLGIPGREQR